MKRKGLLFLMLLLAGPALGEVYKWVDEQGRVQYGDAPPKGVKAQTVSGGVTVVPAFVQPAGGANDAPASAAVPEVRPPAPAAPAAAAAPEAAAAQSSSADRARTRAIELCQRNRGVDCEDEVDTSISTGTTVFVPVPGWSRPPLRPRPLPGMAASSSARADGPHEKRRDEPAASAASSSRRRAP